MSMHNGISAADESKSGEEQHETRANGWCFCAQCNEAREDIARYDDGPQIETDDRGGEE